MIEQRPMGISNDEFSDHLHLIVGSMTADQILSYGNVYTELAEALNNEVIQSWEQDKRAERLAEAERLGAEAGEYCATHHCEPKNPYGADTEGELWEAWEEAYENSYELAL